MADAIQFTVSDDDSIELTSIGRAGSIFHQGGSGDSNGASVVFVESSDKPAFDPSNPSRFKDSPVTSVVNPADTVFYSSSSKIWAISSSGDQLITVTPSVGG